MPLVSGSSSLPRLKAQNVLDAAAGGLVANGSVLEISRRQPLWRLAKIRSPLRGAVSTRTTSRTEVHGGNRNCVGDDDSIRPRKIVNHRRSILESPWLEQLNGVSAISRTLLIGPSKTPLSMLVAEEPARVRIVTGERERRRRSSRARETAKFSSCLRIPRPSP